MGSIFSLGSSVWHIVICHLGSVLECSYFSCKTIEVYIVPGCRSTNFIFDHNCFSCVLFSRRGSCICYDDATRFNTLHYNDVFYISNMATYPRYKLGNLKNIQTRIIAMYTTIFSLFFSSCNTPWSLDPQPPSSFYISERWYRSNSHSKIRNNNSVGSDCTWTSLYARKGIKGSSPCLTILYRNGT